MGVVRPWLGEPYTKYLFTRWPGGAYVDQGAGRWKLLLHTLEGSVESGMSAFRNGTGCPHFTVDLDRHIYRQHIPMDRHAYALRNAAGGTQTNRDHVIQVEVAGFARDTRHWSLEKLAKLAFNVIEPIMDAVPDIELAFANFDYNDADEGYGLRGKVRMSAGEWDAFSGILGHVHAPENTHWDPGALNTDVLLGLLTDDIPDLPPSGDDDMALIEKYRDPNLDREWVAFAGAKLAVAEYSKPTGTGTQIPNVGYLIDAAVGDGVITQVTR